ncbi:MAG: dihydrofolate reductase [Opitutaceae bacterium]
MPKPLNMIVACAENRAIGRGGRLPWKIPEDFASLQKKTLGNTVVLGRVCFQSWPSAMPGRQPIVITRDTTLATRDVKVAGSLPVALAIADGLPGEIYICGGQRVYEETMLLAEKPTRPIRLHLTLVHAAISGDRFFPEWTHLSWRELRRRESADANYRYTFLELERS